MIWDPPSPKKPRKKKKSKIRKQHTESDTLVKKHEKPGKREYEKPWKLPQKNKENQDKKKKYNSEYLYSLYPDGEGPDTDLILGLESYLIDKNTNIKFDDIAGLKDAKVALKLNVVAPLKMKNYF